MQLALSDVPNDLFSNPSNYAVSIGLRMKSQTPYPNVNRLTYEIRNESKLLVIDAWGSGFVSGHFLEVSVTIAKKNL